MPFAIRNIRLFIAFRVFFNARFYYPVFTILFLDYGLTIEQFSILNTVWAITIVLAEVPSGALADIIGRKRLLVATAVLMVLEMSLIAFVPLGNGNLIFTVFLINRICSGLAEALASGADEAMAYDSLAAADIAELWPKVLSMQMRISSLASVVTGILGALVYDPSAMNTVLQWFSATITLDQQTTMRFPIYLTLILALAALATSLLFQETASPSPRDDRQGFTAKSIATFHLTMAAGRWILRTPFAMAIIIAGMFYDHIIRLTVTLTSQYFRLIQLPEASFGLISAALSMLGLLVPKLAEKMVQHQSPQQNMLWLAAISLTGLFGLTGFFPYIGLLPMALVFMAIMLTSFFTSHYLNRITSSAQRATVLSFKGLAFNLAYGLIGFLFAALIHDLRRTTHLQQPDLPPAELAASAFMEAVGWFPWYSLGLLVVVLLIFRFILAGTNEHRRKG